MHADAASITTLDDGFKRVVLRLADPQRDAAAIHDIYEPWVTDSATSFEQEPPGTEAMAERIAQTMERYPWLVAVEGGTNGRVLGYAYGTAHRARWAYQWSAEVAVYVDGSARGRGVGRRLYEALFTILRAMGIHSVFGGITLPNEASVALHRAMGFEEVGVYRGIGCKFGRWHDVQWWQKAIREKREHEPPLPAPRWLPESRRAVEAWLAGGAVGALPDLDDDGAHV
jgi:phosphinothricin acetyltransferase